MKAGGVQDDVVELAGGEGGQQVEHIGGLVLHGEAVEGGVFFGLGDGGVGDIHADHLGGPGLFAVEAEGAGVGEAVQHPPARGDFGRRGPVVFLV